MRIFADRWRRDAGVAKAGFEFFWLSSFPSFAVSAFIRAIRVNPRKDLLGLARKRNPVARARLESTERQRVKKPILAQHRPSPSHDHAEREDEEERSCLSGCDVLTDDRMQRDAGGEEAEQDEEKSRRAPKHDCVAVPR